MEGMMALTFAVILSVIGGSTAAPWGWLAGPVIIGIPFGLLALLGLVSDGQKRRSLEILLKAAADPADSPPPRELLRRVSWASSTRDAREHYGRFFQAASNPRHPGREAFCLLCLDLETYPFHDALPGVLADFLREHPSAESAPRLADRLIARGSLEVVEPAVRQLLSEASEAAAVPAASTLVLRAESDEAFRPLVRALKDRIAPLPIHEDIRRRFVGLTS